LEEEVEEVEVVGRDEEASAAAPPSAAAATADVRKKLRRFSSDISQTLPDAGVYTE
jgi:hypothetical protein